MSHLIFFVRCHQSSPKGSTHASIARAARLGALFLFVCAIGRVFTLSLLFLLCRRLVLLLRTRMGLDGMYRSPHRRVWRAGLTGQWRRRWWGLTMTGHVPLLTEIRTGLMRRRRRIRLPWLIVERIVWIPRRHRWWREVWPRRRTRTRTWTGRHQTRIVHVLLMRIPPVHRIERRQLVHFRCVHCRCVCLWCVSRMYKTEMDRLYKCNDRRWNVKDEYDDGLGKYDGCVYLLLRWN